MKTLEREQLTVRLPGQLVEQLRREAEKRGISVNATLIILLRQALGSE